MKVKWLSYAASVILSTSVVGTAVLISAQTSLGSTIAGLGGRCIDVAGGEVGLSNGAPSPLILFRCTGGDNQQWSVYSDGTIRGLGGRCIDVAGGEVGLSNGAPSPLILFRCTGGDNQQWSVYSDGTIRGLGGRCIDVAGGEVSTSRERPSQLILFPCTGKNNQQWRFQRSSDPPTRYD